MKIYCVWEHNGDDSLIYSSNIIGAYTRGARRELALSKMQHEIISYLRWKGEPVPETFEIEITQEKESALDIRDADSDVIFEAEKNSITLEEYNALKALALKSAFDFHSLYNSVPDKTKSCLPARDTFYGQVPRTADEMYAHTKNVNSYYFGEINIYADNDGTIVECRQRGFEQLEKQPDFLSNIVLNGSYGETWSLRKVLRRFIWHDRIHAKAMYRMAKNTFGKNMIPNIFSFDV